MIRFILGLPGAGKGVVLCQKAVIEEIVNGDRPVVAYFALRFNPWIRRWKTWGKRYSKAEIGLQAYLWQTYGQDFGFQKRVFLLDKEQANEFYLWRVVDGKLVQADAKRDEKGRVISFDQELLKSSGPVMYAFDEVQKFYPARGFAGTPEGVLNYTQLHRHAGDDVWMATQHTKFVDVNLTRVGQEFWMVRNHGKLSIGIFQQPDIFSISVYDHAPMSSSSPMSRFPLRLDKKGIGGCFDTTGGLESDTPVIGSQGDLHERKRGFPWWGLIILILLIMFFAARSPVWFGKVVGGHYARKAVGVTNSVSMTFPKVNSGPVNVSAIAARPESKKSVAEVLSEKPDPDLVKVTGWMVQAGKTIFFLDNGRDLPEKYVKAVFKDSVLLVDGSTLMMNVPKNDYVPFQREDGSAADKRSVSQAWFDVSPENNNVQSGISVYHMKDTSSERMPRTISGNQFQQMSQVNPQNRPSTVSSSASVSTVQEGSFP